MKKTLLSAPLVVLVLAVFVLGDSYFSQNSQIISLQTENLTLQVDKGNLQNENANLQTQLTNLNQTLSSTQNSLTSANATLQSYIGNYSKMRTSILQRSPGTTETEQYVTPNAPAVIQLVSSVAGSYSDDNNERWSDYLRLLNWVHSNIKYSSDTSIPILPATPSGSIYWKAEYWKYPYETIEDKTGDCEDQALLLVSLLSCYAPFGFYAIEISDGLSGHVAVAIPVQGGNLTILDPVSGYYTSMYGYIYSKPASQAITEYLNTWKTEMPNAKVNFVFNDTLYKEFSSTTDFINWVIS